MYHSQLNNIVHCIPEWAYWAVVCVFGSSVCNLNLQFLLTLLLGKFVACCVFVLLYFSSSDLIELLSNSVFVQFVFKKSVRIMYGGISLMKHTWCMHILLHTLVYAYSIAHWCVLILSHTQRCWSTLGSPMHTYLRTIFRWPKAYGVCIVIFWCNDLKGTETNILFATQLLMCVLLQGLFSQILFFSEFSIEKERRTTSAAHWLICLFLQPFVTCWR